MLINFERLERLMKSTRRTTALKVLTRFLTEDTDSIKSQKNDLRPRWKSLRRKAKIFFISTGKGRIQLKCQPINSPDRKEACRAVQTRRQSEAVAYWELSKQRKTLRLKPWRKLHRRFNGRRNKTNSTREKFKTSYWCKLKPSDRSSKLWLVSSRASTRRNGRAHMNTGQSARKQGRGTSRWARYRIWRSLWTQQIT